MISISIIIPVYNDRKYLELTLLAIKNQFTHNDVETEVIIVDNGSSDDTVKWLQNQDGIKVLLETNNLNSPYSCRNRGIEVAKGEIIILLDATCLPEKEWLINGINFLESSNSHVVGGNVLFDFEGKLSAAKIYDSLTNIKMKESIERKGVAKTANLFIKKEVFDIVGLFPEGIRSGADVRWTYKVSSMGLKITFCPNAVVYKPARGFRELLKKQWRVGKHQPLIWREQNKKVSFLNRAKHIITPVSPRSIRKLLKDRGTDQMQNYGFSVWIVAQLVKMTMGVANIIGIIKGRTQ